MRGFITMFLLTLCLLLPAADGAEADSSLTLTPLEQDVLRADFNGLDRVEQASALRVYKLLTCLSPRERAAILDHVRDGTPALDPDAARNHQMLRQMEPLRRARMGIIQMLADELLDADRELAARVALLDGAAKARELEPLIQSRITGALARLYLGDETAHNDSAAALPEGTAALQARVAAAQTRELVDAVAQLTPFEQAYVNGLGAGERAQVLRDFGTIDLLFGQDVTAQERRDMHLDYLRTLRQDASSDGGLLDTLRRRYKQYR